MTKISRRVFERPPSLVPAWVRAFSNATKPMGTLSDVPFLHMEMLPQRADSQLLARYRRLCGFVDGPWLPVTFPQVMAGALHITMVTDPRFPAPAAGLVHLRNQIESLARIGADDPIHFACHVDPPRQTARGLEFDLVTLATVHGNPTWRSVITMLARSPGATATQGDQSPSQKTPVVAADPAVAAPVRGGVAATGPVLRSLPLRAPEDLGRRYAAIAGDYNPIHLHAAAAKLFGFPRAIAHGMWSLARVVAECQDDMPPCPMRIDASFRKPVLLPAKLLLTAGTTNSGVQATLKSVDGSKIHLVAELEPMSSAV